MRVCITNYVVSTEMLHPPGWDRHA